MMRLGWLVVGCGGDSGGTDGDGSLAAAGVVDQQRALTAGCVSVRRDAEGLLLETTTFDEVGWPVYAERPSSSLTYEYVREGAKVVSMTSTRLFFDSSSKTVTEVEYDEHQHVASVDGVLFDNDHDGELLTDSYDPYSGSRFEYDACEHVVLLELGDGFLLEFVNVYATECLLEEVRSGGIVSSYVDGRVVQVESFDALFETTEWSCP